LASQGATALLSWGCAAALDRRLKAGCILLPEHIFSASGATYPVTAEWHQSLHRAFSTRYHVLADALMESTVMLTTPDEKQTLARRTQAITADMESAAQARFAQEHGLPFAAVRVVIDTTVTNIPPSVSKSFDAQGDINHWKFAGNALLH